MATISSLSVRVVIPVSDASSRIVRVPLRNVGDPVVGRSQVLRSLSGIDYAGACSPQRDGRCFRFVYDEFGKPDRSPQPLTVTGMVKFGRWHEGDACTEHADQQLRTAKRQAR
jgi:hypothetical protein